MADLVSVTGIRWQTLSGDRGKMAPCQGDRDKMADLVRVTGVRWHLVRVTGIRWQTLSW